MLVIYLCIGTGVICFTVSSNGKLAPCETVFVEAFRKCMCADYWIFGIQCNIQGKETIDKDFCMEYLT